MLEQIGGECAGAVTFIPAGETLPERKYGYRPVSSQELAAILKELPKRPLLAGEDGIRLSLAGAQDKVAVRIESNDISLPLGGAPSTHILKPAVERFAGVVFNEAFCMRLAAVAGLPAAKVETRIVEDIEYLVVERYDRVHQKNAEGATTLDRLHQEDFCQAQGIVSEMKYQKEGGPSLKQCFALLREVSSAPVIDLSRLLDAVKVRATYKVKNYTTEGCSNLYAFICERSVALLRESGRFGMIIPMSAVSTDRMLPLRNMFEVQNRALYISNYSGDAHPAILFSGVKMRLSIVVSEKRSKNTAGEAVQLYSTGFIRWYSEARPTLFETVGFAQLPNGLKSDGLIPKAGDKHLISILKRIREQPKAFGQWVLPDSRYCIYAHRIVAHFIKCFDFVPYFKNDRDGKKKSEDYKVFAFADKDTSLVASAVLNSNLFYLYYLAYSDAYHCGRELILNFPCDLDRLKREYGESAISSTRALMSDLKANARRRRIEYHGTGWIEYDEFYPKKSKPFVDEIDRVLCPLFALSAEELDYVLNFDVKFRLGQDNDEGEEPITSTEN